jgi:hypothetical protein
MSLLDWPLILFFFIFGLLWLSIWAGGRIRIYTHRLPDSLREDFTVVLGSTLTLLGLIIGFTFSMATTRYDLRKSLEAAEANAIGTEYSRLDFLPAEQANQLRPLMRQYTDLRIQFYQARRGSAISGVNAKTDTIGEEMWGLVSRGAKTDPSALTSLAAAGMNEVLDSREFTQAAWWNRIPFSAWALMFLIAVLSNVLLGYGAQGRAFVLSMILPLAVGVCFFLIADIDSPIGGIIRVQPSNLSAVYQSIQKETRNL